MLKKDFLQSLKNKFLPIFIILVGSAVWSLTMVRSGLCWNEGCSGGLGFWGANGHDGLWHLSLINNFANGNFGNPVFAGYPLQNYHIGFDLLLSWVVRLTGVSASVLYFQIVPPLLAVLVGALVYKFVYLWKKSNSASAIAIFFVYFGGSMGWIVSLLRSSTWGGESMFWSMQSVSTLINPPFALSLVLILLGLISIFKYQEKKKLINIILAILCFGLLAAVKIYASLLVLTALFVSGIYSLVVKRNPLISRVFIGTLIVSILLYIPLNGFSGGNLVTWKPFWFLESMMALSDRVGWQKFYSAMTTYRMGGVWGKAIIAYTAAFLIFVIGNFGTRILALKSVFGNVRKVFQLTWLSVFLMILILAGITVPTFFVQKGTAWNTIQFLYYSLFFTGIIAGVEIEALIKRKSVVIKLIVVGSLILFTIPTTVAALESYMSIAPQSILPEKEAEALSFLNKQDNGVVLTYPYIKGGTLENGPTSLYLYTTTAYVSAYSGKPVFLEDEMNVGIMQYDFETRRESVEQFLDTLDEKEAYQFLRDNNITYVYWLKDQHARVGDKQLGLTKIFDNGDATIYVVN